MLISAINFDAKRILVIFELTFMKKFLFIIAFLLFVEVKPKPLFLVLINHQDFFLMRR